MEQAVTKRRGSHLTTLHLSIFLVSFPFGIIAFVLPIYSRQMGASALEIGSLFSAFSLAAVLLRPLVGRAIDRYGRKPFFLIGIGAYMASMLLFFSAHNLTYLFLARMTQGVGSAFLWLSAYAMVSDLASGEERGSSFGQVDQRLWQGALVGTTVGMILTAFLGLEQGWRLTFSSFALLSGLALLLAWIRLEETQKVRLETEPQPLLGGQLAILMAIVLLTSIAYSIIGPIIMIFLQDRFSTEVGILALAYLPSALIYSFLPSHMGRIADKVGRRLPMALGLLTGAIFALLLPNLRSLLFLTILWAAEALAFSAATPAEEALVADLSGQESRGTAFGLYTFAYSLGSVIGPPIGGWLYDHWGYASPFYLTTVTLLLGTCLIALAIKEREPSPS